MLAVGTTNTEHDEMFESTYDFDTFSCSLTKTYEETHVFIDARCVIKGRNVYILFQTER